MKKVSDILSKCISLMYAIYIPLSFGFFIYLSVAYKGNMLYGYIIDIVKIIVILLFANNVLFMYKTDEDTKNPSKLFVILAGVCLLEFVYTVCMHGKYNYGGNAIPIIYFFFFVVEFIVETVAFDKLFSKAGGEFRVRWALITFLIINLGLMLRGWSLLNKSYFSIIVLIVLSIFLRDIIKFHFLIKSVIMRKQEVCVNKEEI